MTLAPKETVKLYNNKMKNIIKDNKQIELFKSRMIEVEKAHNCSSFFANNTKNKEKVIYDSNWKDM